jgi:hypothetical protein
MAATREMAERWHRALLSIYYHGRRAGTVFRGEVPTVISPLETAVTALIDPLEDEALGPVRLALADLCRTRARAEDAEIDQQIARLATAFSQLIGNSEKGHPEVVAAFNGIFQDRMPVKSAYERAIKVMVDRPRLSQRKLSGEIRPALVSYNDVVPK